MTGTRRKAQEEILALLADGRWRTIQEVKDATGLSSPGETLNRMAGMLPGGRGVSPHIEVPLLERRQRAVRTIDQERFQRLTGLPADKLTPGQTVMVADQSCPAVVTRVNPKSVTIEWSPSEEGTFFRGGTVEYGIRPDL